MMSSTVSIRTYNFVWYFEKEISCDIETLSIDEVLKNRTFLWKNHSENVWSFTHTFTSNKNTCLGINSFAFWHIFTNQP